jgi:small subunit ribosomal protein S2
MSSRTNFTELLEAGSHFGHLKRKWNPAMAPYIYSQNYGIHIIDIFQTYSYLSEACKFLSQKKKKRILSHHKTRLCYLRTKRNGNKN